MLTDHSTLLQRAQTLAWIAAFAAGCTSEATIAPDPEVAPDAGIMPVDPTGNWDLIYMFSAGCGQPESVETATFTVTRAPNGYAVSVPGATASGTLICTPSNCKLSAMFAWSDADGQFQQNVNMVLDAQGGITGNGTESVMDTTETCSVVFKVQGTKS